MPNTLFSTVEHICVRKVILRLIYSCRSNRSFYYIYSTSGFNFNVLHPSFLYILCVVGDCAPIRAIFLLIMRFLHADLCPGFPVMCQSHLLCFLLWGHLSQLCFCLLRSLFVILSYSLNFVCLILWFKL
jgi:hypothetical protein